jgi:hypothetical protein
MTIKNLYPKARPQSIYNVINGRRELPLASTFSRASGASFIDSDGLVKFVGNDVPRVDHDYETGEVKGLLLEPFADNRIGFVWPDNTNGSSNPSGTITKDTTDFAAPDGTFTATKCENIGGSRWSTGSVSDGVAYTASCWARVGPGETGRFNFRIFSGPTSPSFTVTDKWQRFSWSKPAGNGGPRFYPFNSVLGGATYYVWGFNLVYEPILSSTIKEDPREPDVFSLTSSGNFDGGFSLLLDSDTTTDDYFYKIKANGSTIAELSNANGTLDWNINGQSAAINDEYPQVGAIQPGRVRTISSFGESDGTTQQNYLYTEGLSFPTNAIVASGADEVEFGPGQTLKAAYLWNGQLSNTEAVSVIKGEYNIVSDEPIKADSYSFVYNTDPNTIGETSITLPYIVPTVSMRVFWGDGTSTVYEQGVTPSHSYPYPGQYRIQIVADDGLDATRIGLSDSNVITRVDQWHPEFRVNAAGPGYTGDQVENLLTGQKALGGTIPTFKYTDLTTLERTFSDCTGEITPINLSPYEYIPTNLPLATNLIRAFSGLGRYNNEPSPDRTNFPTLTTSTVLTELDSAWANCKIINFVNDRPLTVSSSVQNWKNAFAGNELTNLIVDTSGATSLEEAFARNNFVVSPSIDSSNCTNFRLVMNQNDDLTTQIAWNTSSGTNFEESWKECGSLVTFPLLDFSNGTNFTRTWIDCSSLTSFPAIDTSSGTNFSNTWANCTSLTSFPSLDFSSATNLAGTFGGSGLTSIPSLTMPTVPFTADGMFDDCSNLTGGSNLDFSNCTSARVTFRGCSLSTMVPISAPNNDDLYQTYRGNDFTALVAMDTSSVTTFYGCVQYCQQLVDVSEIVNWDLSLGTSFYQMFNLCPIVDFPANMFDTTGTLNSNAFDGTWQGCALSAQSIENILVSLDANGQSNIALGINGGTNAGQSTWSAAANTAYNNLIAKGWTITANP